MLADETEGDVHLEARSKQWSFLFWALPYLNVISGTRTVAVILKLWGNQTEVRAKLTQTAWKAGRCWVPSLQVLDNILESKMVLCPISGLFIMGNDTFTYC